MSDKKRTIFEETLTQAYAYESYRRFLGELLNHVQFKPQIPEEPFSTFSVAIKNYVHIGDYEGGDHQKIALFSVCLKNDKSIENARSMQRAFVKSLLEASNSAGALVAFYTDADPGRWRLSMVRMDYGFTDGKISVELTPAKRYSYLVGEGEPCHTAKERLYPIFAEDDIDPGLDDLEEAFSVEAVTKEFFAQYREKYLSVKEFLEHNTDFVREAGSRGFNSEQFAKKLMGQLVFLYFIQKKGWLGVNAFPKTLSERAYKDAFYQPGQKPKELMPHVYRRNEAGEIRLDASALRALSDDDEIALSKIVQGGAWGDGPKDFMRQLFNDCRKRGKNFFDDYLEPLFYEGLNQNRGDQAFFLPLHSRIPFLNGGLFEELEGYDWKNNDFCIPDELFSNADENGRDADGILDVFDRYNFTMVEDEPMEREVAVDPEMLGKVFENLLDVKDRKSKGAFYTPREIVHYMCQESLICYLSHKTGIADGDIRKFILYGEYFREEDIKKTKPVYKDGKKHHMVFDKDKVLEIPETIFSYRKDVNRLQEMDNLLANVKVLDPAVGSGAFPLGMLTEIVKARETLTAYMGIELNKFQRYALYSDRRTYRLKRETIKNSIFACDLEASAADITKLRLWLSLVIDDQIRAKENEEFGEMTKPRELPNLDCNIICGNSLVDAFHGIKLITENSALGNLSAIGQGALLYDEHFTTQIHRLMSMQDRLYDEKTRVEKERIKREIQEIYDETILTNLNGSQQAMNAYYECKNDVTKPFILWQLMFPKVFRDNGGFDIVIGNPPYIQLQTKIDENTGEKLGDQFAELGFQTFAKTGDIYCLFYEKGYQLLSLGGVLTYITSNKWMRAGYGEKLRSFFAEKTNPLRLIDFGKQKIFASATVDVNILMFTKSENEERTLACTVGESCSSNLSVYIEQNSCRTSFSSDESWVILSSEEHHIRNKINTYGVPLKEWDVKIYRGILTGFNDAFIISSEKKDELIAADPKSAELIRPILRGRDVKRYGFSFSDLWLITTHNGIKSKNIPPVHVEDYPAIHKHLDEYYPQLAKRADKGDTPYNLRNCVYMNEFFKQKIIWGNLALSAQFAWAEEGYFINAPSSMIVPGNKYLLAVLNSKLADWYIRQLGVTRNGGYFEYKPMFIEQLPVPVLDEEAQIPYIRLVDKILEEKRALNDTQHLESEINQRVYALYHLREEEILYIESQ
mgnify:CR=1 FL=1